MGEKKEANFIKKLIAFSVEICKIVFSSKKKEADLKKYARTKYIEKKLWNLMFYYNVSSY